eukprot:4434587-Pyramimonas_sp.AAC.1
MIPPPTPVLVEILRAAHLLQRARPRLLGLHAAIKPLLSHPTTGEFNPPRKYLLTPKKGRRREPRVKPLRRGSTTTGEVGRVTLPGLFGGVLLGVCAVGVLDS